MSDSVISFAKKAWGSMAGMQRAARTNLDASSTLKATKTFGINWSKANDYSVPLKTKDGDTIYARPDHLDELKSAARVAKNARDRLGGYEPIEARSGGKTSEIDPDDILGY